MRGDYSLTARAAPETVKPASVVRAAKNAEVQVKRATARISATAPSDSMRLNLMIALSAAGSVTGASRRRPAWSAATSSASSPRIATARQGTLRFLDKNPAENAISGAKHAKIPRSVSTANPIRIGLTLSLTAALAERASTSLRNSQPA